MSNAEVPLVNCHTHLELSWMGEWRPPAGGEPFIPWIGRLAKVRGKLREAGRRDALDRQGVEQGIQALLEAGVTHVGDISQTGYSVEPLLDSGLAGVVYLEVIGPGREQGMEVWEQKRRILERYRPQERNGLRIGLSPHAPYSTHPEVIQAVARYCVAEEVPLCIHVAESPGEVEALLFGTGPFPEYARQVGVDVPPVPGIRPVAFLARLGVLEAKPLLVHMVQVDDAELDLVAAYGAKIAHCPRSNTALQCGRMPLEKMLARGIPVALGTDSLASSPSLDVREEAGAALALHNGYVSADDIMPLLQNTAVLN